MGRAGVNSSAALPSAGTEPKRIGRYLLFEAIARGGMAQVHLARLVGPAGFSRIVAIKRLHPHLALEAEFVSMFLDEARLAARVRHPNVVPILDVVSLPDELFLVMEYVSGESLWALSQAATEAGQRVPADVACAILVGALSGLHAAHEATNETGAPLHIVHRDVSPQNIIVGDDGLPRVLDFGIAHAAERLASTRSGEVKGKPAYMSPEQIRGAEVDRRTDVYAVGVVAWELFTGLRLFAGKNDAHTFGLVTSGDKQSIRDVVPEVPPALEAAVMKAIELEPSRRFEGARDFAVALEKALTPASQRAVAEWVERSAGAVLADRARRVARIEGGAQRVSEIPDPTPASQAVSSPDAATALATAHAEVESGTSVVTGDMTAMRSTANELGKPRDRLWLALGGSLLGAVFFCAVFLVILVVQERGSGSPPGATQEAHPAPSGATGATPVHPAAAGAASEAPAGTVDAAVEPDAGSTIAPSSTAGSAAPKPPLKPPVGSKRTDPCNPPFTYQGRVKVPKPECF